MKRTGAACAAGVGGLVAALGLATASAAPISGAAPQPIQGAWRFEGGTVLIQPVSRHRFVGIVVRRTTFGTCPHPSGQRMWLITGSGRSYAGTHLYFKKSLPCAVDRPGEATWVVNGTGRRQTLRFCSAEPDTGPPTPSNPTTLCHTLPRARVPARLARTCTRLGSGVSICVSGPAPLRTIGCLPRRRKPWKYTVALVGRRASSTTAKVGPLRLDRRRLLKRPRTVGRGHSFTFSLPAARFAPGPHSMLGVARVGGVRHTLKQSVWICD